MHGSAEMVAFSCSALRTISVTCLVSVLAMASSPVLAAGDGVWRDGADVYSKICTYCHDAGVGPVIKGLRLPPELIMQTVRQGLLEMPAFPESFIDNKSLQDLAKYVSEAPAPQNK
jgi:mono/diheme cytochrome c family protein